MNMFKQSNFTTIRFVTNNKFLVQECSEHCSRSVNFHVLIGFKLFISYQPVWKILIRKLLQRFEASKQLICERHTPWYKKNTDQ